MIERYLAIISLHDARVDITVQRLALLPDMAGRPNAHDAIVLQAPTARVQRGHDIRLVTPSAEPVRSMRRDERPVELIADAHSACTLLLASPNQSTDRITSAQNRCRTQFARLIKLSYLAPDIVTMILD